MKTLLKEPFVWSGLMLAVHALVALLCRGLGWVGWEWPLVAIGALAVFLLAILISCLVLSLFVGSVVASTTASIARASEKRS